MLTPFPQFFSILIYSGLTDELGRENQVYEKLFFTYSYCQLLLVAYYFLRRQHFFVQFLFYQTVITNKPSYFSKLLTSCYFYFHDHQNPTNLYSIAQNCFSSKILPSFEFAPLYLLPYQIALIYVLRKIIHDKPSMGKQNRHCRKISLV